MSGGALSKTFGTRTAMAPAFLAACDTAQVVQCLGEALNASWRDFDFQKGLFEVYRPKTRIKLSFGGRSPFEYRQSLGLML